MQPDFSGMTKTELRAYIIAHPGDKFAFHAFVDRFTSEASPEIFDLPRSSAEVEHVEVGAGLPISCNPSEMSVNLLPLELLHLAVVPIDPSLHSRFPISLCRRSPS